MSVQLPNPAQLSDVIAALLQTVAANPVTAPVATISSTGSAAGNQTYVVVAFSNGAVIPSAPVSTTTGPTVLAPGSANTINWSPLLGAQTPVTYNVYRTAGGTNQGLIASGLSFAPGVSPSFVDNGIGAANATTPPFNTFGATAGLVSLAIASGAITQPSGTVFLGSGGALAMTLAAPIAGLPAAGGQDGYKLTIIAQTAHAHTVTTPANKINGSKDTATFAAIGDQIELIADGGVWWAPTPGNNTTLSEV